MRARRTALLTLGGSALCFGLMAFLAKLAAGGEIGGAQMASVRFAISLLPALLVPSWRRASLSWQRTDLLVYRGVFGGLAVLCFFLAIEHIPVGTATLLNYTSPVFAATFAALFAGERARAIVIVPLAVALAGVALVVSSGGTPPTAAPLGFGVWESVGLLSALLSGAALVAIRVARRTESSWAVFTSFSLFGLLATLPFGLASWVRPTPKEWTLLVAMGIVSIVAQLLMTHGYKWVDNVTAGVIAQLAVIVATVLGVSLLGDPFPLRAALGTVLTIGGVIAAVAVRPAVPPEEPAEV